MSWWKFRGFWGILQRSQAIKQDNRHRKRSSENSNLIIQTTLVLYPIYDYYAQPSRYGNSSFLPTLKLVIFPLVMMYFTPKLPVQ